MRRLPVLFILMLIAILFGSIKPASAMPWATKVDPWVLEAAVWGETEFLLLLDEQADLSAAVRLANKAARGQFVYQALTATARRSQAPVIAALQHMGVEYRPYWIVNAIWVRGDLNAIVALAGRPDVRRLSANPAVALDAPEAGGSLTSTTTGIEWNISLVGAPDVWALGYTGQGVVVGGADTGYYWQHEALQSRYRGWDGENVVHDYNWYDATLAHSLVPVDPYGHGTHTMGIMVGDDGADHQIGMAPGARWIGCRNMNASGYGTPETYIACYQWFVAPTRVDGVSDPRPDMAPDVINNSWSCPESEGCTEPDVLLEAVQNVRAAGILTVHSAGNSGSSGCGSINYPAAIYAETFTVGATDSGDVLADFSSRGPVTVDGSNRRKPNVAAPGVGVNSCITSGGYAAWSGTSMAAPHVAGLAALLISSDPTLHGQVERLELTIEQTALSIATTDCSSYGSPNNLYGWGRIQALQAAQALPFSVWLENSASAGFVLPGDYITYTLAVTNSDLLTPVRGVSLTDLLPVGTEFVSASEPYQLIDTQVIWDINGLAAGMTVTRELVVRVGDGTFGAVVNMDYNVTSNEASPVRGEPVITMSGWQIFLPLAFK